MTRRPTWHGTAADPARISFETPAAQLDKGFDNGAADLLASQEVGLKVGRKRKHAALVGEPVAMKPTKVDEQRHLSWGRRVLFPKGKSAPWKTRTVHRVAAKNFVADLDHQIIHSTPLPGLIYFQKGQPVGGFHKCSGNQIRAH